jgi:hypothetical protein
MRQALIFAFVLALSSFAWGVPALVGTPQTCGGTNGCTTAVMDTTGATLLVVAISEFQKTPAVPTDSKSNSWTALTEQVHTNTHTRMFYSIPGTVGASHTFTTATSSSFAGMAAMAFSGTLPSSAFEGQSGSSGSSPIQPGSLTPSFNNELFVSAFGSQTASVPTIDSGFSTPVGILNSGTTTTCYMAYLVKTPIGAVNPSWTQSGSPLPEAVMATFKPIVPPQVPTRKGSGVW